MLKKIIFPKIIACMATVIMLLRTATINEYCYNGKINKTPTADKWSVRYKWQTVKVLLRFFFFYV